jgi:hypothetical protein
MMTNALRLPRVLIAGLLALLLVPVPSAAQESKSIAAAAELTSLLDAAKLDAIAAKDERNPGRYVAALYFPGAQLLVVRAEYSVPVLLDEKLAARDYRDVYIDLNSASVPETKVFVEDLAADGLRPRREENRPFDIYETATTRVVFDGDWRKQKLTEQEYLKMFEEADAVYTEMLKTLTARLKRKTS